MLFDVGESYRKQPKKSDSLNIVEQAIERLFQKYFPKNDEKLLPNGKSRKDIFMEKIDEFRIRNNKDSSKIEDDEKYFPHYLKQGIAKSYPKAKKDFDLAIVIVAIAIGLEIGWLFLITESNHEKTTTIVSLDDENTSLNYSCEQEDKGITHNSKPSYFHGYIPKEQKDYNEPQNSDR
jgi:hypothetical protein